MWREVALVLVATAFISGSARPAPTALSERLDRYPESGNPRSEVRWTRSDPFEPRCTWHATCWETRAGSGASR